MEAIMILIVEDTQLVARVLTAQIGREIPDALVSCVADGENAFKALTGEEYEEFDPPSNSVNKREKTPFVAAIWDNTFPVKKGSPAEKDTGLRTVEALKTSEKVDKGILTRFISHSSDDPEHLIKSKNYVRVFEKPMSKSQIKEVGLMYQQWCGPNNQERKRSKSANT